MLHGLATLTAAALAFAQQVPPTPDRGPTPTALPHADSSDDIIVSALRIPREALPTQVRFDRYTMLPSRIVRERSELYLRCAIRRSAHAQLRQIVDGEPNSPRQRAAQGWLVLRGSACQPGLPARNGYTNQPESVTDLGASTLDRGILIEQVLRTFAADAALTPAETADPEVRARHAVREGARNRLRFRGDRDAWQVSSCLVREQPVLATRLMRSAAGTPLELGLVQTLLVDGRTCLGDIKRLTIDPTFLRGYVADAYYRWLVAARNVASLVPPPHPGSATDPLPPGGTSG